MQRWVYVLGALLAAGPCRVDLKTCQPTAHLKCTVSRVSEAIRKAMRCVSKTASWGGSEGFQIGEVISAAGPSPPSYGSSAGMYLLHILRISVLHIRFARTYCVLVNEVLCWQSLSVYSLIPDRLMGPGGA